MFQRGNLLARGMNVALGIWLVVSAFLWPHLPVSREANLVGGAACAAVALVATVVPRAHWWNAAVALALFGTIWLVPHAGRATPWNDGVAAFLILVFALVPAPQDLDDAAPAPHRARA